MASDLTLNHVSKSYPTSDGKGRKTIIEDITLHVPKGSFVTLLGGNGCGKSTLLRSISGMEEPDSGEILIDGKAIPRLGRVGLVSQEINLFPWLTALQNTAFGLEIQGMPAPERKELATAYLRAFGLGNYLNHYPRELSGGMRQKVAIARTLVTAPDIILMDEPFSALDYQTRTGLQCFFLQLWAKLRETILFVTHEVEEAVFLSDYIVVINPVPSSIKKIIHVELPRPRRRDDPDVLNLSAEVLHYYGAGTCMADQELKKALDILGLKVDPHSTQIVQRDRYAHFFSAIAIMAGGIERLCVELRHLQRTEVLEVEEGFAKGQKGSSAMPHKKNPDVFEIMRGRCNRLQSVPNEIALLTTNLPVGYHRDLQLLKDILFPATTEIKRTLAMCDFMLAHIRVNEHILDDKKYDYLFTVEDVNRMVLAGTPFREAYKQVGMAVQRGEYTPTREVRHTHEGSIGNLCTAQIRRKMERVMQEFE